MAKRKTFYVSTAIFEEDRSAYAVAVYAYLCFCADKSGVCFPGIEAIAAHTGMSRSSVKRALAELERSGHILQEQTAQLSPNGKRRQGTNRYRILDTPVQREPAPRFTENPRPGPERTAPRSTENREINDNSIFTMGDVPSVGINACEDTTGLDAILRPLHLDTFFDRVFAQSIGQTIRTMYDLPFLSVNGTRVPNALIRERLRMLTIDHIDYIEQQLDRFSGEVTNGGRYLTACIYNAPVDCMVRTAHST